MTTVNPPTSNGGAFEPLTLIRAEEMNDELDAINYDLNYITGVLQSIYEKLDTIEPGAGATLSSDQIIALINLGSSKINVERLSEDVSSGGDVTVAIANHRTTTTQAYMHPQNAIKSTELTYSNTPTSYITSPVNLLDELKNLRYAIHKVTGKTTWIDTPTENLTQLTAALDVVQAKLAGIESGATADMSASEILTAVKTVDGAASGLDADLLDGQHGSYYASTSSVNSHLVNISNPHSVTKSQVGLANVLNVQQFPASNVETGTSTNGLTTYVPSSYTMNNVIGKAFGASGGTCWLYRQDTSSEGGQINFETANASSYPHQISIDRVGSILRLYSVKGSTEKVINVPQLGASGSDVTSVLMSVPDMGNHTSVANEYWSGSTASYVQNTISGPLMILGGTVCRSNDYGYVQWSTNGSAWNNFSVATTGSSPATTSSNPVSMGAIPCAYVSGTLYLKAGSTYSGASSKQYGGSYQISYVRL
jgi:hypothetical protein